MGKKRDVRKQKPAEMPPTRWIAVGAAVVLAITLAAVAMMLRNEPASASSAALSGMAVPASNVAGAAPNSIEFTDLKGQMKEFIRYNRTIELTPEQEAVKKAALETRPAACCADSTAYTCCCDCNLSKSLWGLANYLIAKKGMDADQVARVTADWMKFANPDGYSGNACYTGGCARSPRANGCGGMEEGDLVV